MEVEKYLDKENKNKESQWEDFYIEEENEKIYEISEGLDGEYHAIETGIGSGEDLKVSIEEINEKEKFKYAAQLIGTKEKKILIYPEINFSYKYWEEGILEDKYNEENYAFNVYAYPPIENELIITQEGKERKNVEYELSMSISSEAPLNELKYALVYSLAIEKEYKTDIKETFETSKNKADFIGYSANETDWKIENDKLVVNVNKSYFNGAIAKDSYNKKDFKINYKFIPTKTVIEEDGKVKSFQDDDLIGFIFNAKDKSNFYIFMMEREDNLPYSARASDKLGKVNLNIATTENIEEQGLLISPYDYKDNFSKYYNEVGWKRKKRRIFKVENNILKQISDTTKNGITKGWKYEEEQDVKVISVGKRIQIYIGKEESPTYDFISDYDGGSYGACNISQTVDFTEIVLTEYLEKSGRWPRTTTDWMSYKGVGSQKYANGIICEEIIKKDANILSENKKYVVTEIKGIKESSSKGTVTAGIGKPLVLNAFNEKNAGEIFSDKKTIKDTFILKSDNNSIEKALVKNANIKNTFKKEIDAFREKHREGEKEKISYEVKIVKGKDIKNKIQDNKLLFWSESFETSKKEQTIKFKAYEYEKEKIIFTSEGFKNHDEYSINVKLKEENENIKAYWIKSKDENTSKIKGDKYAIKIENEKYMAEFDGENEGIANSIETKKIAMPKNFYKLNAKTLLKNKKDSHYFIESVKNKDVFISFKEEENENKTENQNNKIYIRAKEKIKQVPFKSKVFYGNTKVNGKKPFLKNGDGKENNIIHEINHDIETRGVLKNLKKIVEVSDERVQYYINEDKKITFYSDYKEDFYRVKNWKGNLKIDSRTFETDKNGIVITDPVDLNILDELKNNPNVKINSIRVKSNNPFVLIDAELKKSQQNGLIANYYEWLRYYQLKESNIEVKGTYKEFEERFEVREEEDYVDFTEEKEIVEYYFGGEKQKGKVESKSLKEIKTIYVENNKEKLCVAATTIDNISLYYCDLFIVSPKGEEFGFAANNGTWSEVEITKNENAFGEEFNSCLNYKFSGDQNVSEWMIFENPVEGEWKIFIDNPLEEEIDYILSTNIGEKEEEFYSYYNPKEDTVSVKLNNTEIDFEKEELKITPLVVFQNEDLITIEYVTNDKSIENNFNYKFKIKYENGKIIKILDSDENEIPEKISESDDGYTYLDGVVEIHGSYKKEGIFYVIYSTGEAQKIFKLIKDPGLFTKVYVNNELVEDYKYNIVNKTLEFNDDVLRKSDVVSVVWHEEIKENIKNLEKTEKEYIGNQIETIINKDFSVEFPESTDLVGLTLNTRNNEQVFEIEMQIEYYDESGTVIKTLQKKKEFTFVKSKSSVERFEVKEDFTKFQDYFKQEIQLFKEESKITDEEYNSINKKGKIIYDYEDVFFYTGSRTKETTDLTKKINFEILTIPEIEESISDSEDLEKELKIEKEFEQIDLIRSEAVSKIKNIEKVRIENQYIVNWSGYIFGKKSGSTKIIVNTNSIVQLKINRKEYISPESNKKHCYFNFKKGQFYEIELTIWIKNVSDSSISLSWVVDNKKEVIPAEYLRTGFSYYLQAKVKEDVPMPWVGKINNGFYYMQQQEFYLFGKKQRKIINMIEHLPEGTLFDKDIHNVCYVDNLKTNGSPIIIRNSNGVVFEKAAFYEEYNSKNEEKIKYILDEKRFVYFPYKNIDTESIEIKQNGTLLQEYTDYNINDTEKRIEFSLFVENTSEIEIKWKIKNSYIVESYKEDVNKMFFKFFGDVTKNMEIIYEVEMEKYLAKELQINPFYSNQNTGFIAISYRKKTNAKNIFMSVSPDYVLKGSIEPILIQAKVTDEKNRSLPNENVLIYRDGYLIEEIKTNDSGEIFYYDNNNEFNLKQHTYMVVHENENLTQVENVKVVDKQENERYYIVAKSNKNRILANNKEKATITFNLKNKFGNNASGKNVLVTVIKQINGTEQREEISKTTNSEGRINIEIKAEKMTKGNIHVICEYDHIEEKAFCEYTIKVIG